MQSIKNPGFTIIELMIAVAIIGVLAAVSIPAYQNYIYRAKVTEVISFAHAAQNAVVEYYQTNGTFPVSNNQAGLASSESITTSNIKSVTIGNDGEVSVLTSISGLAQQFTISLIPTSTPSGINWQCKVSDPQTNNQYVPANCRS